MIGYGLAKAAVHHLVKSLAEPKSGLPPNTLVTAILPYATMIFILLWFIFVVLLPLRPTHTIFNISFLY